MIYGLPDGIPTCEELIRNLQKAVSGVAGLSVKKRQVVVFLPRNHVQEGLGEELVGVVQGLYRKPERTPDVRDQLAEAIGHTLLSFAAIHLPQCECVEVCINSTNLEEGGHRIMHMRDFKK